MTTTFDEEGTTHRYAQLEGITLHYVEAGEGPLIVLLHGFPEFWYSWRHQIHALAKAGYRVVAPDMRGYNLSDKPPRVEDYHLDKLTADVAELIRSLGCERAVVVGHDWGGAVAWAFAMAYPAMIDKLCILNLPHPEVFARGLRTPRQLFKSWYMFFFQLPSLPEALLHARDFRMAFGDFEAMVRRGAMRRADLDRYHEAFSRPSALGSAINYYRAAFRNRKALFEGPWPRIEAPVLVIWGMRDQYLGSELAAPNPALVPNARVERIADGNHFIQADKPEEVNRLLLDFIGSAAPPS